MPVDMPSEIGLLCLGFRFGLGLSRFFIGYIWFGRKRRNGSGGGAADTGSIVGPCC